MRGGTSRSPLAIKSSRGTSSPPLRSPCVCKRISVAVRTDSSTLTAKRQALDWLQPCRGSCTVGPFELPDYFLRTRPAVLSLQICVKPLRRTVGKPDSSSLCEDISGPCVYARIHHEIELCVRAGIYRSAPASQEQQQMMETSGIQCRRRAPRLASRCPTWQHGQQRNAPSASLLHYR